MFQDSCRPIPDLSCKTKRTDRRKLWQVHNNCIISSDLYSEALSRINTTTLRLVRRSAVSACHVLNAFIASSFVFIPYSHLYPVAASTKTIAWLYLSIDSTDDENESICIWYSGLLIGCLAFGKSSTVALPIMHDGHLV